MLRHTLSSAIRHTGWASASLPLCMPDGVRKTQANALALDSKASLGDLGGDVGDTGLPGSESVPARRTKSRADATCRPVSTPTIRAQTSAVAYQLGNIQAQAQIERRALRLPRNPLRKEVILLEGSATAKLGRHARGSHSKAFAGDEHPFNAVGRWQSKSANWQPPSPGAILLGKYLSATSERTLPTSVATRVLDRKERTFPHATVGMPI